MGADQQGHQDVDSREVDEDHHESGDVGIVVEQPGIEDDTDGRTSATHEEDLVDLGLVARAANGHDGRPNLRCEDKCSCVCEDPTECCA